MGRSGRLAIGAIAAAVCAAQVAPAHLLAGVALAMAAVLLLAQLRPTGSVRGLAPIAIGAGLLAVRMAATPAGPAVLDEPPEGDGPWALAVLATGSPREGQQTATLGTPPGTTPAFEVAATLPRYPVIVPGDRILVSGVIRERPDSPYGTYLARIGAVGTLTSRTLELEPGSDDPGRRLEAIRRGAAEGLAVVLPEPEAGLAAGILIGLRDLVDRDLAAAFTTAGVSHVVAISGWNIAIVAAAIGAASGRLGRRRRSIVTVVAIVVYVAFAGASPSVVRAALMAGVVLLARESGRAGRATAALGWAATLLLLADPSLIGDAGFQLSSLATAGLIAWGTPLTERIDGVTRGRLPRAITESLGVSLAAQVATLPIILVSFGRLAILSPIVNLVVVPLVAPAMAAGLVALAAGAAVLAGAPPIVGAIAAAPGWVILRLLVTIVDAAASLPFASVTLDPPFDAAAAMLATAGVGAIAWRTQKVGAGSTVIGPPPSPADPVPSRVPGRLASTAARPAGTSPARRASVAVLGVALLVAGGLVVSRPPSHARVSILDVGQGDAILVEGARGGRLLVDGGPDPDRLLVALDQHVPPWDRRIDVVILSHPHEDHVAGLALLLARYRVTTVFEPGMRGPGPGYAAWSRRLDGASAPARRSLGTGDRLAVDDISLRVLWPAHGSVPSTPPDGGTGINNVSVVLLGEVAGRRFLLMGDVEDGIDPALLREGLPRVDLLKIAHHGSRTATTEPFIEAVHPKVAIASAGAGNPYGHPAKATLDRLTAAGARVLRTDRDGTVVVGFEAGGVMVHAEGSRGTAISAVAVRSSAPTPAFLCAVPVTGVLPAPPARSHAEVAGSPSWRGGDQPAGRRPVVGYHRDDDGARAAGGRLVVALSRSRTLDGAPRARRGRGGGLARHAHRRARHAGRPPARRVGRAPPRRRQDPAARPSVARAPPRPRLRRMAGRGGPSRAVARGREPPGHPPGRRRCLPALGRVRVARGADRGLCRQARRAATRADGCPLRLVGPAPPEGMDRRRATGRAGARQPTRGRRLSRGRGRARDGAAPGLDRASPAGRPGEPAVTTPLAFLWGDDELSAARALDRFQATLETEGGAPLERWLVRGDRNAAASIVAAIHERVATPVMFGGGTLAVVANAGGLVLRNEDRDAFLGLLEVVALGNALAVLDASQSGAKGPTPKRLADAIAAAGGTVRQFKSPREGALAGWIEAEARERGLQLAAGSAKTLAERVGGFVREADAERGQQTRLASMELDKLGLYRGTQPITPDDVAALVPEAIPGSVWAFTDAVAERRLDRALGGLDILLETTPEPVILAVLHRRVRELIETGDRLAAGERLPAVGKAMGVASEFRMERLREQAKRWTTIELIAALDGLLELDAMVKGAPGTEPDEAQRRLAFSLWVIDHAGADRLRSA